MDGPPACVFFFFLFLFHNLAELGNENELTSPSLAARSCFVPVFPLSECAGAEFTVLISPPSADRGTAAARRANSL